MTSQEVKSVLENNSFVGIESIRVTERNILIKHAGGRAMIKRVLTTKYMEELETR